jgi:hypothetical protein
MFRVLHVLDHSLPLHSGYTFRTRAILKAQAAQGLEVRGITGLRQRTEGAGADGADGAASPAPQTIDGLTFHRTPGTAGVAREWGEIAALSKAIGELVAHWRPDVIHAHSPALCGYAALRAA